MPLDGHEYLTKHGWRGKGTALRDGGISRPVIITQKKSLSGLGKDRDEAFPFWDHVFAAAASAIKVKVHNDDDEGSNEDDSGPQHELQRTSTGIISNRRPIVARSTPSGSATPSSDDSSGSSAPRVSLLSLAKREAARRGLYSRFLRGEVIKSIDAQLELLELAENSLPPGPAEFDTKMKAKKRKRDEEEGESKRRKRKEKPVEAVGDAELKRKRKRKKDVDDSAETHAEPSAQTISDTRHLKHDPTSTEFNEERTRKEKKEKEVSRKEKKKRRKARELSD